MNRLTHSSVFGSGDTRWVAVALRAGVSDYKCVQVDSSTWQLERGLSIQCGSAAHESRRESWHRLREWIRQSREEVKFIDPGGVAASGGEDWGCALLSVEELLESAQPELRASLGSHSELELRFLRLAEQWRAEIAATSSVTMMAMHPAYQRIIGMGPRVVPLILRELRRKPDHWFWALTAITGQDPIRPEDAGDILRMTQAWLDFGERQGYL